MKTSRVASITAGQRRARQKRHIVTRPGVIAEIQHILEVARDKEKPLTTEQILTRLSKKFPDRDIQGMEVTVRAQLSRLPREKQFPIDKEREGRLIRYAAA